MVNVLKIFLIVCCKIEKVELCVSIFVVILYVLLFSILGVWIFLLIKVNCWLFLVILKMMEKKLYGFGFIVCLCIDMVVEESSLIFYYFIVVFVSVYSVY